MASTRDIVSAEESPTRLPHEHDFALVIGVDHYPRFRSLHGAIADATAFHAWACADDGGGVAPAHARLIISTSDPVAPVQDQIDEALLELLEAADRLGGGRRLYFYFSGHGAMSPDQSGDDVALLLAKWSVSRARLALSSHGYTTKLGSMGLFEELAIFLDCCRATAARAVGLPPTITYETTSGRCPTRTFLAYATEAGRAAFERPHGELWQGVFTRTLLAILRNSGRGLFAIDLKDRLEWETDEAAGDQQAHVINGLGAHAWFGPVDPVNPHELFERLSMRGGERYRERRRQVVMYELLDSIRSVDSLVPTLSDLDGMDELLDSPRSTRPPEPSFVVESAADVHIRIYDTVGRKMHRGDGLVSIELLPGSYRVQLERAGRLETRLIFHEGATHLRLAGPPFQTPAPLAGAAKSHEYYENPARRLGATNTCPPLGPPPHRSRLSIFLRREAHYRGPPRLPSEPVTLHDATGRLLLALSRDTARIDDDSGYLAYSSAVAPGTYRLRAARTRRDIAITIPADRAAHVFIADDGNVRLDGLRVALRPMDARFDPASEVARAMESVIAALRAPDHELPAVARALLPAAIDEDLCFGVAAAHLLWRSRDLPALRTVLDSLLERAGVLPDVAILDHLLRGETERISPRLVLSAPPLMRASLIAAMTRGEAAGIAIDPTGAIGPAARTAFHDSIWCTWSDRPWDARWIEPTLGELRMRTGDAASLARSVALPIDTVHRALERLDAKLPSAGGTTDRTEEVRSALDLCSELDAPLEPTQGCALVLQALSGLAHLHARGIVHGDIEPGTLLVRAGGNAALADRWAEGPLDRCHPTATIEIDGSPHFAPREQLLELQSAQPASDVWSMAATLYFLLTLELPRDVYADQSDLEAALHNPIVPIAERRPELPAALARCIDRALSDDPAERPTDAAALRTELAAARWRRPPGSPASTSPHQP